MSITCNLTGIKLRTGCYISKKNVAMCNHSCEITFKKFIINVYEITRVSNIPSLNIWLLSRNNCIWYILGSLTTKYCILTVYCANNFTIFTAGRCYMLPTDGSVFHFISTDFPKMAQSYVFVYRYSIYVIFQRPEILRPWLYLPEKESTFPYE
jgi:ribosomal protein L28